MVLVSNDAGCNCINSQIFKIHFKKIVSFKVVLNWIYYNSGMRILYVEDEKFLAEAVIHLLKKRENRGRPRGGWRRRAKARLKAKL